jgi:hypothetical protein
MRKLLIAILVAGVFAGILLVAATAQNKGCLPWKQPITVGGSVFDDETNRAHTVCR